MSEDQITEWLVDLIASIRDRVQDDGRQDPDDACPEQLTCQPLDSVREEFMVDLVHAMKGDDCEWTHNCSPPEQSGITTACPCVEQSNDVANAEVDNQSDNRDHCPYQCHYVFHGTYSVQFIQQKVYFVQG